MKYRRLGRTALKVSELCLGTMNFGPRTSDVAAFQILDRAIDAGINLIDTANQYGGDSGVGTTELILGKWFQANKVRRDKLVLATKVYEPMSDDVNDRGLSARHIVQACEDSLKRLNVDHIDLYQMHHLDRTAPLEEIWQAMDLLIQQGKILYVGSSNFPGWVIAKTNEYASAHGRLGLVSEQSIYSLIERRIELEVLPACRAYGVGAIVWSPLGGGLLADTESGESKRRNSPEMLARRAAHAAQLGRFGDLCKSLGQTQSSVALAWVLHQAGISAVAVGPGSIEQLEAVLGVPDVQLGDEAMKSLDEIFPPCGEAPEAYAW